MIKSERERHLFRFRFVWRTVDYTWWWNRRTVASSIQPPSQINIAKIMRIDEFDRLIRELVVPFRLFIGPVHLKSPIALGYETANHCEDDPSTQQQPVHRWEAKSFELHNLDDFHRQIILASSSIRTRDPKVYRLIFKGHSPSSPVEDCMKPAQSRAS